MAATERISRPSRYPELRFADHFCHRHTHVKRSVGVLLPDLRVVHMSMTKNDHTRGVVCLRCLLKSHLRVTHDARETCFERN